MRYNGGMIYEITDPRMTVDEARREILRIEHGKPA